MRFYEKTLILFIVLLFCTVTAYAQPRPYTAGASGTLTTATAVKIPASALTYAAYGQILQAKAIFFTIETASVNFTFDGTTPTATAGTNAGHNAASGQWFFFDFPSAPSTLIFFNAAAASGALVKYTIFF
jgi:hypothetical protein